MALDKSDKKFINSQLETTGNNLPTTFNNPEYLSSISGMGMRHVDPMDIRPPQIILVQKTSKLEEMIDKDGKNPRFGQFFHSGEKKVYDTFNCYFLTAVKGEVVDKYKNDGSMVELYQAIGMMPDRKIFAINFRGSAKFALSSLFSQSTYEKMPMFGYLCTVESKLIEGQKGSWHVPVVRVGPFVKDDETFEELFSYAQKFDKKTTVEEAEEAFGVDNA